jgi:Arc/MetJ family transcription regulator
MHKTTIEVDLEQLREAERNLGTEGFKETVNVALREVNRRAALKRGAQYLREGRLSVPTMAELRRMRANRS